MTETPGDRIRKLLLRADNTLKNHVAGGNELARVARARRTLEEAREIARDPDVPAPVRALVERRLGGLDALDAAPDDSAGTA